MKQLFYQLHLKSISVNKSLDFRALLTDGGINNIPLEALRFHSGMKCTVIQHSGSKGLLEA